MAIDPGMSTGISLFTNSREEDPWVFSHAYQVTDGLTGFLAWCAEHDVIRYVRDHDVTVISEKFTPRSHGPAKGFTQKSVEPLRVEGAIQAMFNLPNPFEDLTPPRWRQPSQQYFSGGDNLEEKKRKSRDFLEKHGITLKGSDLGAPNEDDATSATLQGFAYLRDTRHRPTLETYFKDTD